VFCYARLTVETLFYFLSIVQIATGLYLIFQGLQWLAYARRRAATDPGFYAPRTAVLCSCKGLEPGLERNLVDALYTGRLARRRTGAVSWRVWCDAADPGRVLEQFVVGSWDEHLRQHERVSRRDQQRLDEVRAMTDPSRPTTVTHWLAPQLNRDSPPTPSSDGLN